VSDDAQIELSSAACFALSAKKVLHSTGPPSLKYPLWRHLQGGWNARDSDSSVRVCDVECVTEPRMRLGKAYAHTHTRARTHTHTHTHSPHPSTHKHHCPSLTQLHSQSVACQERCSSHICCGQRTPTHSASRSPTHPDTNKNKQTPARCHSPLAIDGIGPALWLNGSCDPRCCYHMHTTQGCHNNGRKHLGVRVQHRARGMRDRE
jgi:hypothetical protein